MKNRLVAIREVGRDKKRQILVAYRCVCGRAVILARCRVKSGVVRSCGCLHKEQLAKRNYKHGMADSAPEYRTWKGIIQRCTNPRTPNYPRYGGRGITICAEWRNDFAAFYLHIGNKPSPAHSIDRIDNSRGYEPGNVRWATVKEQNNNKRIRCRLS